MKNLFLFIIISFTAGCNTVESNNSTKSALPVSSIDSIKIEGYSITATVTVTISTPCWYYLRTERIIDDSIFTAKIFGQYDGEICIQVISSLTREEKIEFSNSGKKKLQFWVNDSTYLDTLVTIQ